MRIVYATSASRQLREIWEWNATHYSTEHADQYLEFLSLSCRSLLDNPNQGKPVQSFTDLRYLLIRRKSKGHAHIAVYRVTEEQIDVLRIYHSAQDWQTKLVEDPI